MTETEIERLVVRLTGDATSYVKMLTDAQHKTQDAAKKVEEAASKIEKFQKGIEGFASATKNALAVIGITATLKGMYEQFDHADDTITELTSIIEVNGRSVGKVLPMYQDFAKEMASVTTATKGSIIELAKQAELMGLSGEKAQKAIKTAITLGAMKDSDPGSFMRQAVNFEKTGNAAGLARILGMMGEMEEDTDKAAEAAKLLEKNWTLVVTKGEDGGARIARSLNELKSLGKDAGEVISRNFEPLIEHLESAVKLFKEMDPVTRKTIATFVVLIATTAAVTAAYALLAERLAVVATAFKSVGAAAIANPLAVVAVLAVAAAFAVATYQLNKFNEALSENKKLSQKSLEGAVKSYGGGAMLDRNILALERQLNEAKKRKDEADKPVNLFELMGANAERAEAARQVEELQKLYNAAKNARDAVKNAIDDSARPSKETIEGIRALNEELNKGIQTVGMSSEQVKIYELRIKAMGDAALEADLDVAEYNARMLDAARAQQQATDSAKDLIKSLELQVKTLGMTDREAAQVKLAMEGVDADTMKRVDNLYKEIEVWEAMEAALTWGGDAAEKTKEQFQALNAVVAGGADAAQLIYQYSNQFDGDTGAVNKAATLRRADFSAQPDRNFLGPQLKGADAMKETEKKLDDLKTVLEQIRDKEQIALEGADLVA